MQMKNPTPPKNSPLLCNPSIMDLLIENAWPWLYEEIGESDIAQFAFINFASFHSYNVSITTKMVQFLRTWPNMPIYASYPYMAKRTKAAGPGQLMKSCEEDDIDMDHDDDDMDQSETASTAASTAASSLGTALPADGMGRPLKFQRTDPSNRSQLIRDSSRMDEVFLFPMMKTHNPMRTALRQPYGPQRRKYATQNGVLLLPICSPLEDTEPWHAELAWVKQDGQIEAEICKDYVFVSKKAGLAAAPRAPDCVISHGSRTSLNSWQIGIIIC